MRESKRRCLFLTSRLEPSLQLERQVGGEQPLHRGFLGIYLRHLTAYKQRFKFVPFAYERIAPYLG